LSFRHTASASWPKHRFTVAQSELIVARDIGQLASAAGFSLRPDCDAAAVAQRLAHAIATAEAGHELYASRMTIAGLRHNLAQLGKAISDALNAFGGDASASQELQWLWRHVFDIEPRLGWDALDMAPPNYRASGVSDPVGAGDYCIELFPRLLGFMLQLTKQSQTHLASLREGGPGPTLALERGRRDAPWVIYLFSHLADCWAAMFDNSATKRVEGDLARDPRVLWLEAIFRLVRERHINLSASPFATWRVDRKTMARYLSRAATRHARQLGDQKSLTPQQRLEIARVRAFAHDTMFATGVLSSTSEVSRTLQIALRRFVYDHEELLIKVARDHQLPPETLHNIRTAYRAELGRFVDNLAQHLSEGGREGPKSTDESS
jgi:hypothetical protein